VFIGIISATLTPRRDIMASLSIQSVDEQLAALLKQRAAAAKKSVSQFVLDTLRQHLGLEKEKRFTAEHDDLDSLFGAWTEEEFDQFGAAYDETFDRNACYDRPALR
jgi:plasmid stability protein